MEGVIRWESEVRGEGRGVCVVRARSIRNTIFEFRTIMKTPCVCIHCPICLVIRGKTSTAFCG
jgi:hypothetical protein